MHTRLENLNPSELLSLRLCDLDSALPEWLQECVHQLYRELSGKRLNFRPHIWVSSEWSAPYGVPGFTVPFYLLHPKLMELELAMMGEVEGASRDECLSLLRHECGHAIDNAFWLRMSKTRQQLFGLSTDPYPLAYTPKPYSKKYVQHLKNHYAQAHPDEDWAETFAVWLDPQSNWSMAYAGWPALKKLEFLDATMQGLIGKSQRVFHAAEPYHIRSQAMSLQRFYEIKRRRYRVENAVKIPKQLGCFLASEFHLGPDYLRENRARLVQEMVKVSEHKRYTVELAYDGMLAHCERKSLSCVPVAPKDEPTLFMGLLLYLNHFVRQKRFEIPV